MNNKNVVWLSSYPKSGNTWFRAFLTALYSENEGVDINKLWISRYFADRSFFNYSTGLNSYELHEKEIDQLKPEVIKYLSSQKDELIYIKVHEHLHNLENGTPIIPVDCSFVALYFIRNPLDVLVSFAHHNNWSIEKMLKYMNIQYIIAGNNKVDFAPSLLHENLNTWSNHVSSWVDNNTLKVEVVRYEDMQKKPLQTFKRALEAINLFHSDEAILKALELCTFEKLQDQEKQNYFIEKNPESTRFFREGKVGSWRKELSDYHIEKIIHDHHEVMKRFGYLTECGIPKLN